jgi:dCMP deaminase
MIHNSHTSLLSYTTKKYKESRSMSNHTNTIPGITQYTTQSTTTASNHYWTKQQIPPQQCNRITFNQLFMQIAHLTAQRSPCLSRQVGAVAVQDNRIIATGYNGPPPKTPHCSICKRKTSGKDLDICYALHAEQNLIIQCAIIGTSIKNAVIFITHKPCFTCLKMLKACDVKMIIYDADYPDKMTDKAIAKFEMNEMIRQFNERWD